MEEILAYLREFPNLLDYVRDFNLSTGFLWTISPELDLIQDRFSANFDPLSLSLYLRQVQSVLKSVGG